MPEALAKQDLAMIALMMPKWGLWFDFIILMSSSISRFIWSLHLEISVIIIMNSGVLQLLWQQRSLRWVPHCHLEGCSLAQRVRLVDTSGKRTMRVTMGSHLWIGRRLLRSALFLCFLIFVHFVVNWNLGSICMHACLKLVYMIFFFLSMHVVPPGFFDPWKKIVRLPSLF